MHCWIPITWNQRAVAWNSREPNWPKPYQLCSKALTKEDGGMELARKHVQETSGQHDVPWSPYGKHGGYWVVGKMNTYGHPYWMRTLNAKNAEHRSSQETGWMRQTQLGRYT